MRRGGRWRLRSWRWSGDNDPRSGCGTSAGSCRSPPATCCASLPSWCGRRAGRHPCLLAEITPHDGPTPTGNHVWDDNNLGQKNVTIVDVDSDSGGTFLMGNVLGNELNPAEIVVMEINRGRLPREIDLFVDLLDPSLRKRFRLLAQRAAPAAEAVRPVPQTLAREAGGVADITFARPGAQRFFELGSVEGRDAILLAGERKVQVPVPVGPRRQALVALGARVRRGAPPGEYEIVMIQRQPDGRISGAATVKLNVTKPVKATGAKTTKRPG